MKALQLSLLASGIALAQLAGAAVSKSDQEFFDKAAAGGMLEVEAGKLAESRGKDAQVKTFGTMLVKDHSAANDELKALAAQKGAQVPPALPPDQQKELDKLSKSKSKDFDKDFIKGVGLKDHKKTISLFEKTSKKADDPDVRAFAAKTLPKLNEHLDHAKMLDKKH